MFFNELLMKLKRVIGTMWCCVKHENLKQIIDVGISTNIHLVVYCSTNEIDTIIMNNYTIQYNFNYIIIVTVRSNISNNLV